MEIKALPIEEWNEIADPVYFCVLPFYPEQVAAQFNVTFEKFEDDGLGLCKVALVKWGNVPCMLKAHPEGPQESQYVGVYVRSFEEQWSELKSSILETLNAHNLKLIHQQQVLLPGSWVLGRVDDNNNEVDMLRFAKESSANSVRQSYESKWHKQYYYVKQATWYQV